MKSKTHERMCTGCGKMTEKSDLLRIIKTKEGDIFIDGTGKANGRGAYICKNKECLEKAIKRKALERAFKCKIPDDTYALISEEIGDLET